MTKTKIKLTLEINGKKHGFTSKIPDGTSLDDVMVALTAAVRAVLLEDTTTVTPTRKEPRLVDNPNPLFDYPDPAPYKVYFDGIAAIASGCEGAITRYGRRRPSFINGYDQLVEHRYEPRPEYTNDPERTK